MRRCTMKAMLPWVLGCGTLLAVACDSHDSSFNVPTTPTQASPLAPAPPPPAALNPFDYIGIEIGEVVQRTIQGDPPGCPGEPQWPCQLFRVTPAFDGTVTVVLSYVPDTQPPGRGGPPQSVDISLGGAWAEYDDRTTTRLTTAVTGGTEYPIILWYTYRGLSYELETSLTPK
jgi:hypothetical protein